MKAFGGGFGDRGNTGQQIAAHADTYAGRGLGRGVGNIVGRVGMGRGRGEAGLGGPQAIKKLIKKVSKFTCGKETG